MSNGVLVFDGSNGAAESIGMNRESSYMAELLNREVKLVGSLDEARSYIGPESEKKFSLLITEPFMYAGGGPRLVKYQQFLKSVKEEEENSVVIWSSQSEDSIQSNYGLEKGVHYDTYSTKMSRRPAADLVESLEGLLG